MYSMTEKTYVVEVSHPTNFHSGKKTLTVTTRVEPTKETKSVSGEGFGCGRDQLSKADGCSWIKLTDREAIANFMAEHACKVIKVTAKRSR